MRARRAGRLKARTLAIAFTGLAVLLTLIAGTSFIQSLSSLGRLDDIANNSVVSVDLLRRMASDVYQEQRLVSAHIFEAAPEHMMPLERKIDGIKADYSAAAVEYGQLATYPGELEAWRRLRDDVSRSEAPIDEALRLSRRNRDTEAQDVLRGIESLLDDVSRDVSAAVAINRQHVRDARLAAHRIQRRSLFYHLLLWLVGIAITITVGVIVTRQIAHSEERERQAFAVLEKRNEELDAFAGRVAHDFRGPLTAVEMAASALSLPSVEVAKSATLIQRGVNRMKAMINDLLLLSQIEGVSPDDICDPALAAKLLADNLAERIAEAQATLEVAVAPARVRCRDGLFQQVLSNLAENALKYRRPDVSLAIVVRGQAAASHYELRISDNGIGMSADEAAHAFDPLFRARRRLDVPGTGLGLAIVKRIVEAYGGTTAVESQVGSGSTFTIRLPLDPRTASA
jgi:signal transduction histidine kinase